MMKNTLKIWCVALVLFVAGKSYGQPTPHTREKINVIGKIIHEGSGTPLEYATIAFRSNRDGKLVAGGITDARGTFNIEIPNGKYDISVEFIGFSAKNIEGRLIRGNTNLGEISLKEDATMLDEVEVIAEKTTVEIRLDKRIYNVGKDMTVRGGSVSDVLDNVPSVMVDEEGNISLRGNENVRILIDGKPSGLAGITSTDALRQLPAEAVQKVEVITSPSARYDAEGTAGILNIVLRRSKLQGLNGAITANVGDPFSFGFSGNLNYRVGDFNFFTTTGYRKNASDGFFLNETQYYNKRKNAGQLVDMPDTYMNEHTIFNREGKNLHTNLGVEWYLTPSASLTVATLLSNRNNSSNRENTISQFDENKVKTAGSIRKQLEEEKDKTKQYTLNFTKKFKQEGHRFSIDAQYDKSDEDENGNIWNNTDNTEIIFTENKQQNVLVQSDYVLPIGENSQFEIGYKGTFKNLLTDYQVSEWEKAKQDFMLNTDISNTLDYTENVNAIYSQYGSKWGNFTYLLGLRMEHTKVIIDQKTSKDYKKKDYTKFFPTVNLSYAINDENSFTLGYARRLRRPSSWFINPFPSRSSISNFFVGNPDLDPSLSDTYDIGFLSRLNKVTLSGSLYYQHETDVINMASYNTGETVLVNGVEVPVIRRSPINLSETNRYGFETTINYTHSRKWRMGGSVNLFHSKTEGTFNKVVYDANNFSWFARFNNRLVLPSDIEWQTRFMYRGPREDSQTKRKGSASVTMGFSKDFFNEKMSVAFNVNDIFETRKRKMETYTDSFYTYSEGQWRGRSINLSVTYRFNQKKKRGERRDMGGSNGGEEEFF